jgi:hypothetical protein
LTTLSHWPVANFTENALLSGIAAPQTGHFGSGNDGIDWMWRIGRYYLSRLYFPVMLELIKSKLRKIAIMVNRIRTLREQ